MRFVNKSIILFFILGIAVLAQFKVSGNSFQFPISNPDYDYVIDSSNAYRQIDFIDFTDPSKPGEYKLPSQNLIFAIPPNSNPSFKMLSKKEKFLENTIPEINPRAIKLNDSTLVYENAEANTQLLKNISKPIVELGQKFWFRDFYCVEVRINSHQFDPSTNSIIIYENVEIELEFEGSYNFQDYSPIQIKSQFDPSLKEIIYNSNIAEQFRSNRRELELINSDSWINYNNDYIKIAVAQDVIYRISKTDLENIGAPVNTLDPKTFQLFESGVEQLIFVSGESDGVFDEDDHIEFYGTKNYAKNNYREINSDNQPYNTYLNIYTDTTYYFLTWGSSSGLRYKLDNANVPGDYDELNYHTSLLHFEENSWYQNLNNNEVLNQTSDWNKNKTWYWNWIFTSRNYTINLQDIYPNVDARFYLKLISAGSNISSNAHQVRLNFNTTKIDSQSIDRFKQTIMTGIVDASILNAGNNTVNVQNYPNGTVPNFLAYDWYEIEYPRYNKLINGSLILTVPDGYNNQIVELKITNADNINYAIYKINGNSKKINNYSFDSGELTFIDTVSTGDKYAIFSDEVVLKPKIVFKGKFTNLRANNSQADYIGLTVNEFSSTVSNYLSEIEQLYSIKSKKILVEDIFDEFGFGYPTPESIKEFVKFAYDNWSSPKPSYLTLFGDTNYDYKDYVYNNVGVKLSTNFIPAFGNPISDNWYVIWDLNAPYIPQLKVGRIPILSNNDLQYYLDKIKNNASAEFNEWNKRFLLFSGGRGNYPSELVQLKAANDSVVTNVIEPRPISGNYNHFYKTHDPQSDFGPFTPQEINQAINDGGLFISYVGHSGTATWDNSINTASQLKNNVNRNSVISDFGCSTNKYGEPDIICFGERFLFDSDGQALNYIGNSSLGFLSSAVSAPKYFYDSFKLDSLYEVGNAHIHAKSKLYQIFGNSQVFKVFALSNIILGDPAIRLRFPNLPNLTFEENTFLLTHSDLNDVSDSVEVGIIIKNLGVAPYKEFEIQFDHYYENNLFATKSNRYILPGYKDTVKVWITTKELSGQHRLVILLDSKNEIEELSEIDNTYSESFNVFSFALRDLLPYTQLNGKQTNLKILNPIRYSEDDFNILMQVSESEDFSNPLEIHFSSRELTTTSPPLNLSNKRYWIRYKIDQSEFDFSAPKSFSGIGNYDFKIDDDFSFRSQLRDGVGYFNGKLTLSIDTLNISVLSAGWNAGANCVIAVDGINQLDNSFFAGMGIVVFDPITMNVDTSAWFQLFDNRPNAEALAALINNIPLGKIVVMGVADDGQHRLIPELRTAIKTLGSTKIDQLVFRGSWGIIGRKGAPPGDPDILEDVKGVYDGSVYLEKKYIVPNSTGYLTTTKLGPVSLWDTLFVDYQIPSGAELSVTPIGIKKNEEVDTLNTFILNTSTIPINFISPKSYPYAKFRFKFTQNENGDSPTISQIGVSHHNTTELAINYQTASIDRDTVMQGELIAVNFKASNVGEGRALNVRTKVDLFKSNTYLETVLDSTLLFINPESAIGVNCNKVISTEYETGNYKFVIELDSDNSNIELYEDNNSFELPFVVIKDTVTSISSAVVSANFDGYEIYDGDYVSPNPNIEIFLEYSGTYELSDTTTFDIRLNQKRISFSQLSTTYETQNNRIIFSYKPQLDNGDYALSVSGENIRPANSDAAEYVRFFKVSNENKILYPYNYPNPFMNETYFTFKLTKVPNELKIKIFTIAGRLIREIKLNREDLNYDLNRIYWNGRDEDGDLIANGVYLYKIISYDDNETTTVTNKLAIVR